MQDARPRVHQIWPYALVAAAAFVLIPTSAAVIAWYVDPRSRDIDMDGVHELILTFVMFLTLPALALTLGVLAPSAIVVDRMLRGRTLRVVNVLLGAALGIPALAVFLIGGAFLQAGPRLDRMGAAIARPLSLAAVHPNRAAIGLASFAVLGAIVSLGMRHRRRTNH